MTERLFLLFIVSLPVVRLFNHRLFGLVVPLSDWIFAAAAASWLLNLLRGRTSFHQSRFYRPLALFLFALCLSTLFSGNPARSAGKLIGEIYLMTAAVMTLNIVTTLPRLRSIVKAWLIGTGITAAVGVIGILLFYAGVTDSKTNIALSPYGSLPSGPYPRIQALFLNQNMLCNYLSISIMLLFLARELGWLNRPVFWTLLIVSSITAFFTLSPGLGGIALSVGAWEYLKRPREQRGVPQRALLLCGVAAGVLFVLLLLIFPTPPGDVDEFTIPFTGIGMHFGPRLSIWNTALPTFLDNPLFGRGVGLQVAYLRRVLPSGHDALFTDAHNMYLSIAGQEGIAGLLTFFGLVLYVCRRFLPFPSDASPRAMATIATGLAFLSALLYQGLSGSFEDARHIWVLMGLIVAVDERLVRL